MSCVCSRESNCLPEGVSGLKCKQFSADADLGGICSSLQAPVQAALMAVLSVCLGIPRDASVHGTRF